MKSIPVVNYCITNYAKTSWLKEEPFCYIHNFEDQKFRLISARYWVQLCSAWCCWRLQAIQFTDGVYSKRSKVVYQHSVFLSRNSWIKGLIEGSWSDCLHGHFLVPTVLGSSGFLFKACISKLQKSYKRKRGGRSYQAIKAWTQKFSHHNFYRVLLVL